MATDNSSKHTGLKVPEAFLHEIDAAAAAMVEPRSTFLKNAALERIENCKKKYPERFKNVMEAAK